MSKLDEAFLKAYAKLRGKSAPSAATGESAPERSSETGEALGPPEGEVWVDANGDQFLRPDDGVFNVASFIARTPDRRTRGTAADPGAEGIAIGEAAPAPPAPHQSLPDSGSSPLALVDSAQTLRGPHFQPIAVNLSALDAFSEAATETAASTGHVAARSPAVVAAAVTSRDLSWGAETEVVPPAVVARPVGRESRGGEGQPTINPPSPPDAAADATIIRSDGGHGSAFARPGSVDPSVSAGHGPIAQDAAVAAPPPSTEQRGDDEPPGDLESGPAAASSVPAAPDRPLADPPPQPAPSRGLASELFEADPPETLTIDDVITPAEPPAAKFQAAWEVDRFEFEPIVWELSDERSALWQAAEQLQLACREGLRVLAISSPARGQGRSTLAITLTRMLAATGLNAVLLEGDLDLPSLADKLQMEIRSGWSDALANGLSAEEVAVHSVEDRFTVLPLATCDQAAGRRPDTAATAHMIDRLRDHFDIVLIDAANVNVIGGWIPGTDGTCQIDAALVIQDARQPDEDAMQACLRRLQKLGIENLGLVENFT